MLIQPLSPDDGVGAHREMVLVGPPGTGKTHNVLNTWLVPALKEHGFAPRDILACSFTRAAADEMRQRVARATGLLDRDLEDMCRTIHSESYRLLGVAYGRRPPLVGKKEDEEGEDDGPAITGWEGLEQPRDDLAKEAERQWTRARNLFPDLVASEGPGVIAHCFQAGKFTVDEIIAQARAYEAVKTSTGTIDFTDMVLRALRLQPPGRRLLVVDEAQDLSPLQIRAIEHWRSAADQTVWVGDPDQAIYEFAGADGRHLVHLSRCGVPTRRLTSSRRVPRAPHAVAADLIRLNRDRLDAPYDPAGEPGYVIEQNAVGDGPWVDAIEYLGTRPGTAFILARGAKGLAPYATILTEQGIPYMNERGSSPLKQKKLCGVVLAIHDLRERAPVRVSEILALAEHAPARPTGKWFQGNKKDVLARLRSFVRADPEARLHLPAVEAAGFLAAGLLEAPDLRRAVNMVDDGEVEPHLRIVEKSGADALRGEPRLVLTTFHASKGREADTVVVDLNTPFPVRKAIFTGGQESERRALYVAVTRTKDALMLARPLVPQNDMGSLLGLNPRVRTYVPPPAPTSVASAA